MRRVIEGSLWLALVAVGCTLITAGAAFAWGAIRTVSALVDLVEKRGQGTAIAISLIHVMDAFLIASALLIFAVGMYELFIERITLPPWLVISNLHDLKSKLASVIVMLMAIAFLERLVDGEDPNRLLHDGIAVTLVGALLIAFGHFGAND